LEALGTLRDPDGRVLVEGFEEAVRAPAEEELQAVDEGSAQLADEVRAAYGISDFIGGMDDEAFGRRLAFSPTVNIAGLHTGYGGPGMKTVLPAQASAWLDFRLVPEQRPDLALEQLRNHLDRRGFTDIRITLLARADPAKTPLDDPFSVRCVAVAEAVHGKPAWISPIIGGSLPFVASLRRHIGMPGLAVCDNATYYGNAAHAPNEHIRLEDVSPAIRYLAALLEELGTDDLRK
jgi:acetylornithine deacetylase/succinyl-diaminopimelate desuccinylase-like protein